MDRKLAAILSADVAGFSRLAALDEEGTLAALNVCRNRIAEAVKEHGGRIFNTAGDGFVAEFPSAVQAVRCSVEIQRRLFSASNDRPTDRRLEFRIGINLGDVVVAGEDLLGDGVNIAARVQEIAAPSGICISASVREHLDGKVAFPLTSLGERTLKNIPRPIFVFQVDWQQETPVEGGTALAPPFAARRGKDQPSIVVMPFDNLSGRGDEYFVDGVVEEITAALSCVRNFFVIARQSAFTYKGRFVDVREVGRELGVNYVVEGTVRRGGDRLRISVQLVDAETRTQFWSDRYEGAIEDMFEFQDRIAAQVAGAIHPAIRDAEIELARRRPPTSLRAYDFVMRAYPNLWGRRKDTNNQAIELLRQAIAVDPGYGRAHALLAWCHAANASYLWTEQPEQELEKARAAVEAVGSISDDPTALTAAGAATSICGDLERATTFIEKALALDPNNAWAWARLGWLAIYKDEAAYATERFQRAMTLSPRDPLAFNMKLGMAFSLAMEGHLSQALAIAHEVVNTYPDVTWSYRHLAAWSAMSGDLETARWAAGKLLAAEPGFTIDRYRALPWFQNIPRWQDQMAEGLRKAGLPEH
ncbi:adenylate/guanylate cyclase domain-containing protein (plasmid) [Ensifer adhaerens]|uniref:adenylate/guanylate cyclase domain-containing protein n=1 Tax=Ensifer adhaerens TaxID=106592 RepID=UPI0023A9C3D1|nr:adenylate/guanylate cyclase domain-containing protein [Ensifer adhaerens]WDZ80580.1 adenylate/guanylate cyclase domain-containing protein [Ensifer adhaerens]